MNVAPSVERTGDQWIAVFSQLNRDQQIGLLRAGVEAFQPDTDHGAVLTSWLPAEEAQPLFSSLYQELGIDQLHAKAKVDTFYSSWDYDVTDNSGIQYKRRLFDTPFGKISEIYADDRVAQVSIWGWK